ncbi:hypothetical protein [Salipiger mangrovisoli]|uniref:Uncharacterized protein n=1 Tax=Salipiger mangrovisoli TaxID=2865933 RepID=A0ABR9X9M4_9RHOB|nr:hypothetical protein [Salipiger mangrovisoli]MBE9640136.1 hypothetical protein [Salipiger mangrovisoli]
MIAASDPQIATPSRGILFFLDADNGDDVGPLMAGAVQAIAPLVLGFLLAQRPVTQGLANIGLKG